MKLKTELFTDDLMKHITIEKLEKNFEWNWDENSVLNKKHIEGHIINVDNLKDNQKYVLISMYTNERRKQSTYVFLHTNISVVGICTG